jgi:hypothetical protein
VAVEVKVTAWPASGAAGANVKDATGAWPTTVSVFLSVLRLPKASVTRRRTPTDPGRGYVVDTVGVAPVSRSNPFAASPSRSHWYLAIELPVPVACEVDSNITVWLDAGN